MDELDQIAGAPLHHHNLDKLIKFADLIYFDGPLLSLFRSKDGDNYFFYWVDSSPTTNRWVIFGLSHNALTQYLDKELPLLPLIKEPKNGFLYIADIDSNLEFSQVVITAPNQLPDAYIPEEDSFYDFEPRVIEEAFSDNYGIRIDGDWSFDELNEFPALYRRTYAFTHHLQSPNSNQQLPSYPLRDGFSSVHFFNEILKNLPDAVKPELEAIKYASPGSIIFDLDFKTASILRQIVSTFDNNYTEILKVYRSVHKDLRDEKLLGKDVTRLQNLDPYRSMLTANYNLLANSLELPNPELILNKSANELMALKILLSFFRRLEKILDYIRGNKVKLTEL